MSSESFERAGRLAVEAQVKAAEHIRDCNRCRHLFEIAYEETALSDNVVLDFSEGSTTPNPFNPFFVTSQIMRELHSCPKWPRSI